MTTVNSATWTAFNPGPINTALDIDSATVVIQRRVYVPTVLRESL